MNSPLFPNYRNQQPVQTYSQIDPPAFVKREHPLGVNLLILLGYFVLFAVLMNLGRGSGGVFGSGGDTFLMGYLYTYLFHAVILLLMSIIRLFQRQYAVAGEYFLGAIIIPIVGFGICAATFMAGMFGGINI